MEGTLWIGLILVGIIALAAGVAIGLLIASQRSRPGVQSKGGDPHGDLRELVRIYINPATDEVYPAMEGRIYRSRAGLSGAKVERLQDALARLLLWLEPGPPRVEVGQRALHREKDMLPAMPETDSHSGVTPIDAIARAIQAQIPPSESVSRSIVAQVDEILQERIAGTALENRGVSLSEAPDTGLVVWVGLDRYVEIEAVPDPEIRQAIRAAVAEWEKRQESES